MSGMVHLARHSPEIIKLQGQLLWFLQTCYKKKKKKKSTALPKVSCRQRRMKLV